MAGVVVGDAVAGEEDAVAGQRVPQGQVVLQLGTVPVLPREW